MKPVEKRGWATFFAWLAILEFAAVIAAIVAAFHAYNPDAGGIGRLMLWPAAVHPAWLGIIAALAAFTTAAVLSGKAGRRATAQATCPTCGLRLSSDAPSPNA